MTFDRQTVKDTRDRLQTALDAVAADLGCQIKVGRASFARDGANCSFKIECAVVGDDGQVKTKEASDFTHCAVQYGLEASDLGREFTSNGNTFTVIGCKPKSYKFPILGRRDDGKVFKFPAVIVRLGLGKNVVGTSPDSDAADAAAEIAKGIN